MNNSVRISALLFVVSLPLYGVSSVSDYDQTSLTTLQNQQLLLEQQLVLLQKQEVATLEVTLQQGMKNLSSLEAKKLLDVDPTYVTTAQQYSTIVDLSQTDRASFYYDVFFWVRYVPTFIAQEELQELEKEKLSFPLSSQQINLATTFSQFFYAYKGFFEQWPVDAQKNAAYYAKAKDAYVAFSTTQAFVASLLARQQNITATENQLSVLIKVFQEAVYEGKSITLNQKSQYDHALSVYSSQLKDTTSQQYKQYQLWAYLAALTYYQDLAGIPKPTDKTNAELFHTTYSTFSGFMDTYEEKWLYYEDGRESLDVFDSYNDACKKFLNPPHPKPTPITPEPTPQPVEPVTPKLTASELLDAFVSQNFADEVLASTEQKTIDAHVLRYKNLLQDYQTTPEYNVTDYQLYQLWIDFVPVRYAQLKIIGLTGVADKNKKSVVFAYNAARNVFMKTSSYRAMIKAYPGLIQELTLTAYYGNWLGAYK